MKKFLFPSLALMSMVFVGIIMLGCAKEDTKLSIGITNIKANSTSVEFTIKLANAIKYEYSVAKAGEIVDMIVVENGTTKTITVNNLEENAVYEIKAFAYGQNDTKSDLAAKSFIAKIGGEVIFFKRVLALKFTGTWCNNCPQMTAAMKTVAADDPGRLVTIAVHLDDKFNDDENYPENYILYNNWDLNKLIPITVIDYRDPCTQSVSQLKQAINTSVSDYYATSSVAINSKLEGKKITIEVKAKFAQTGNYKIGCAITENGIIVKPSVGATDYTYNNVLRHFLTEALCDDLGEMQAGTEITKTYTLDMDTEVINKAEWNTANLNVVAYILKNHGDGKDYTNNSAECKIKGKVDFS